MQTTGALQKCCLTTHPFHDNPQSTAFPSLSAAFSQLFLSTPLLQHYIHAVLLLLCWEAVAISYSYLVPRGSGGHSFLLDAL